MNKTINVGKNDAGQRLDKFLAKALPSLTRGKMFKAIRKKDIKISGKRCEPSQKLLEGDVISLYLPADMLEEKNFGEFDFLESSSDLNIAYEDENILIVDKPVGLVVHEDDRFSRDTLIKRIQHYLYDKNGYSPENENSFSPALCNRIDRNTSGLVICAKNSKSLRVLNNIIKHRLIDKRYYAMCFGVPKEKHAILTAYLRKDENLKQVEIFDRQVDNSLKIITEYWVLDTKNNFSMLEIALHTGRTHQIRAHMAHIGHPLLGDTKYGFNRENKGQKFKFQTLCAYSLRFLETDELEHLSYLKEKTVTAKNIGFSLDDIKV